ncbi:another transcription unit protein [Drosophila bipectinata]|uniref:another transcription unit protein n=1 Tax=Drosophila bipectinata TaxID=42026 RepID=UPI001C89D970|nr:another transcription unit protein [Drosophila bipectinata]
MVDPSVHSKHRNLFGSDSEDSSIGSDPGYDASGKSIDEMPHWSFPSNSASGIQTDKMLEKHDLETALSDESSSPNYLAEEQAKEPPQIPNQLPSLSFRGNPSRGKFIEDLQGTSSDPIGSGSSESSNSDLEIDETSSSSCRLVDPIDAKFRDLFGDKLTVKFKATLPSLANDLPKGPQRFLRMPQFIPVEPNPYDAQKFEDQMTPGDLKDAQALGGFVNRLKTTVRWREGQDQTKESNAVLIRWSDGSETFHVGEEAFDVMHHPVTDDQNQIYVRQESCYQTQGSITDKMTLRPKLDSTFGQTHVQGMRNRALNRPQTGSVKILMDMGVNPVKDRERRIKEEMAQLRREEREKRRDLQSQKKPRVKPVHHPTADDSDDPSDEPDILSILAIKRAEAQALQANRYAELEKVNKQPYSFIDDGPEYDEALKDPKPSTSKARMDSDSDPDDAPKITRKTKHVVYSDSSSD